MDGMKVQKQAETEHKCAPSMSYEAKEEAKIQYAGSSSYKSYQNSWYALKRTKTKQDVAWERTFQREGKALLWLRGVYHSPVEEAGVEIRAKGWEPDFQHSHETLDFRDRKLVVERYASVEELLMKHVETESNSNLGVL